MRIGILGTRGIPNHYGGFEQLAEYLSVGLVKKGHEVYVYNSSLHPYKEKQFNGVQLISCYDPEDKLGTAGQFIYDLNCIRDARKQHFDVLLQLGYTSSSVWHFLLPHKTAVITNMDGMEWLRSKYSKRVQQFLKHAEKWAVRSSDHLVADSTAIKQYLHKTYQADASFIAYGAAIFKTPDENVPGQYGLKKHGYYLAIARFEPENNLEMIIRGFLATNVKEPLVLIGSTNNAFGRYLVSTYRQDRIIFPGPVYEQEQLNNLRYFCKGYFHGHSVGGTNPSLLEAMACSAPVAAHDNVFNRAVLAEDARYFSSVDEVAESIIHPVDEQVRHTQISNNLEKIATTYSWERIIDAYEQVMLSACK